MFQADRAKAVDETFVTRLRAGALDDIPFQHVSEAAGLNSLELIDFFESQVMSRHLDLAARLMRARNQGFYTIGSSGHEGNAAIAAAFRPTDMAFLHYRSGAFVVQRSKQVPGSTPIYDTLLSLSASSEDPISGGRHKVFGSHKLFIPPQTSTIASQLPKAMGAALSIDRAAKLGIDRVLADDGVIVCSFGDASANHSTALGAINTASLCAHKGLPMPIVFVCEDNGIGISVRTPSQWVELAHGHHASMKYIACDGRNLIDVYRAATLAVAHTRSTRQPAFLHMKTVRLLGHAGSDVETTYQTPEEIMENEKLDPVLATAKLVVDLGVMSADDVLGMYESVRSRVLRVVEEAVLRPKLQTAAQVMSSIVPPPRPVSVPPAAANREALFGATDWTHMKKKQHMAKLVNWALVDVLAQYPQTAVFGEDVGAKGGVYHVTTGLQKRFGPDRVFDTPLDEQSILGMALGFAHNGFVPIPEIQFLAYVHNAEDQLRGEASTLSYFSSGLYTNPMVLRVAGLAYQKGFGGHFHNDNSMAVFRDLPGVILACPSHGLDAAKILRELVRLAHEEQRVCVFLEPIALYMTRDVHEKDDGLWSFDYPEPSERIAYGSVGVMGESDTENVILTYGNGTYMAVQASRELKAKNIDVKIVDLRWLIPLPRAAILKEVDKAKRILIVDECRRTASLSEEIVTLLVEHFGGKLPAVKRVNAEDCFIPLADAANLVLPQKKHIVEAMDALVRARPERQSS
jgi:2-oxoisovalerate dehydrogenase E1 component